MSEFRNSEIPELTVPGRDITLLVEIGKGVFGEVP